MNRSGFHQNEGQAVEQQASEQVARGFARHHRQTQPAGQRGAGLSYGALGEPLLRQVGGIQWVHAAWQGLANNAPLA